MVKSKGKQFQEAVAETNRHRNVIREKRKEEKIKIRLRRPCIHCEKMFMPTGKLQKVCEKCLKERRTTHSCWKRLNGNNSR